MFGYYIVCKDCKHAHLTSDGKFCKYCDMWKDVEYGTYIELNVDANFFCGYAELVEKFEKELQND